MSGNSDQNGLLPLGFKPFQRLFRLRVNDCVRIDGKLGRVIRVTESAAVVLVQQAHREFTTRFDKHVQFQPPPKAVRISANAEIEVLNRPSRKPKRSRRPLNGAHAR